MTSGAERMFPTLKPEQIDRVAAHGHVRQVQGGEILVEAGERNVPFFIVKTGHVAIIRPPGTDEHIVASLGPGQFTGETSIL
jgi:thioredoxin reductase (NADPH)